MPRKPCAEIESEFDVYIWKVHSLSIPSDSWAFWLCKNCSKIQELENRRDLYTPAHGLFNYHIEGTCICLYHFLINFTLSISIQQIFEVLKHRLNGNLKKVQVNWPISGQCSQFISPGKHQKNKRFRVLSRGIKWQRWPEMGYALVNQRKIK